MDKKHQIVIDAQAFGEGQEHHTLQPVLETVEARFKKLGIADNIYQKGTVVTADTGFANEDLNGAGRQVSFIIENKRLPNYTDWMKHRVDSPKGKEIYSHRMSVVEPVFGNIGTTKRLNRFILRGKKKVQGQWQLYCLVHNIEKLANYGHLAAS
ncbi:transposase [Halomonas sp. SpR1]|uniref:transposase n=1 Tax=Halomonas sp. SpR1 TaxID=3050462 RepID=UPI0027E544DC|nr:transposase [Halomonas sp. SpR1]MDQ7732547.1 transposase [Halomonas sp. SpR1]